jgi:hypothetical protein
LRTKLRPWRARFWIAGEALVELVEGANVLFRDREAGFAGEIDKDGAGIGVCLLGYDDTQV